MKTLLGLVLSLAGAAVALAQAPQTLTITAPNGTFEIRNATVAKARYMVKIKGEIINNTTADWEVLWLRVAIWDRQGQLLKVGDDQSGTAPVYSVKKGIATKLDTQMYGKVKGDIGKFEITFDDGQYPAIYRFSLTKPAASPTLEHEDATVQIKFSIPENKQVAFTLKNKTDNPIKVDWDQVSYVDPEGKSHKAMHQGIRFIERDRSQSPTTIPPGATLEDFVYPSDAVTMIGNEWSTPMLFPAAPKAAAFKGKSFSVFMPLEVNGATKNYNFVFAIEDIQM
jgi:hypothetical protein